MINCNGNENDNEKYIIYLIDLRRRHGYSYTKYNMSR